MAAEVPAPDTAVLKAVFNFTNMRDTVSYFYFEDNTWRPLGQPQRAVFDLNHFAGVRAGLFCYALETTGGTASFSRFEYCVKE